MLTKKTQMPSEKTALPGREEPIVVPQPHFVTGKPIQPPFPQTTATIFLGMGCFWGAERKLWQVPGVFTTAVGYSGGITPNPTYEEVCTGQTGHNEVVLVAYEDVPSSLPSILQAFWESHDPTQGMRQGNDIGTQYRSAIYVNTDDQMEAVTASKAAYQAKLDHAGVGQITTEILPVSEFYYAEDYHQQYLAKNPNGYCGLGGTGVCV